MFSGAVHAPCRILAVVGAEDAVEVGSMLMESDGAVKEFLGSHGEELGLVLRAIGVEKGFVALLGEAAQAEKFAGAHGYPFGELVAIIEGRGAVGGPIEQVKLVGELMVN